MRRACVSFEAAQRRGNKFRLIAAVKEWQNQNGYNISGSMSLMNNANNANARCSHRLMFSPAGLKLVAVFIEALRTPFVRWKVLRTLLTPAVAINGWSRTPQPNVLGANANRVTNILPKMSACGRRRRAYKRQRRRRRRRRQRDDDNDDDDL